jgi:hypothetical protein
MSVIDEQHRKQVESKSLAELQTIIDKYDSDPANLFRQAAMEKKFEILEKRERKNNIITIAILIVSVLTLIATVAVLFIKK